MSHSGVSPEQIPAEEYARRIRALLGPGGPGAGFPRRQRDRWILLHAAARQFAPEERLTEIAATARLGAFLALPGVRWEIDRAALRRALVDEGFLERDPDGSNYRTSMRHVRRVTFGPSPGVTEILGSSG